MPAFESLGLSHWKSAFDELPQIKPLFEAEATKESFLDFLMQFIIPRILDTEADVVQRR